jgi:hypothetical protein
MPKHLYRQGDVLLIKVDQIGGERHPIDRDNGRIVLAYGEATGHAHAIENINVTFWEIVGSDDRALTVGTDGAELVHEEHATIYLSAGDYIVRRQREYTPVENIRVAD